VKERWTVRWFRKRALLYHLLVIIIAPGCLWAGWWQIHRAMQGNALSYFYSVEWPIFAILAVVGWWQLIHEDPADVEARKVERARRAATTGPFVPPPPEAESGFFHPLGPAQAAAIESRNPAARGAGSGAAVEPAHPNRGRIVAANDREPTDSGHVGADSIDGDYVDGDYVDGDYVDADWIDADRIDLDEAGSQPVHALSSYNAYLAQLAAGGGRKSWRNPHGAPPRRRR
jgi:hypothetical protein